MNSSFKDVLAIVREVTEQTPFTRVLGLNLLVASQPAGLRRALAGRRTDAPMLVDAPGLDIFDPADAERTDALLADARGLFGTR